MTSGKNREVNQWNKKFVMQKNQQNWQSLVRLMNIKNKDKSPILESRPSDIKRITKQHDENTPGINPTT